MSSFIGSLRARRVVVVLVLSCVVGPVTQAGTLSQPDDASAERGNPRAYIFLGFGSDGVSLADERMATYVERQYRNKGYQTILDWHMSVANLNAALAHADTQAIWFTGHGFKHLGNWIAQILTTEGSAPNYVDGTAAPANLAIPATASMREVVFHACGQNVAGWRDLFTPAANPPSASYVSWSGTAYQHVIKCWEVYWHSIPAPNAKDATLSVDPPVVDPRINPYDLPTRPGPDGQDVMISNAFTSWRLAGEALAQFGSFRSLNFYLTDPDPNTTEPFFLFGGTIEDGVLVAGDYDAPLANPSYEIVMSPDEFQRIYENRDLWESLGGSGDFSLTIFDSDLTQQIAFDATGSLLLGLRENLGHAAPIPEPATLVALLLVGVALMRR